MYPVLVLWPIAFVGTLYLAVEWLRHRTLQKVDFDALVGTTTSIFVLWLLFLAVVSVWG